MAVYRVEVRPRGADAALAAELREHGLSGVESVQPSRLFLLEGDLTADQAGAIADRLLRDPVVEEIEICGQGLAVMDAAGASCEVHPRPGVMDPVAESTLAELRAEGYPVSQVRTGRRYRIAPAIDPQQLRDVVGRVWANDCIEQVHVPAAEIAPAPTPPVARFDLRHVPIRTLSDGELTTLSRDGHLFLSLDEMRTIQAHFQTLERDPTDIELETLAQTWSEHCVHKTLKSAYVYRGAPMPGRDEAELRYDNLLRDTIAKATHELIAAGDGPECLSVFVDNAGIIGFDEQFGIAFKVETHNHPSAIEPYGGAATGAGGCIRDVMGCGLGARPIANTDVFCVAPSDWPQDRLPKGVLHPQRVLRGIVQGVADYGNRMGIPTVNGAVYFDPRYLGNPLVYCGCVGIIPRDCVEKAARPGDAIVVVGGRTGRDGIHGATFSSAELTDSHADEFSHAVQIGNAITEKRCLDAQLRARDAEGGCLYTAVTDCGAGGLSSAVGEMGEKVGAAVELKDVPLKYPGLRYDEIWISEAQERMVFSVPPDNLDRLLAIMAEEEVEATVIGTFGHTDPQTGHAQLIVKYDDTVVASLDMPFLHDGLPKRAREATWQPPPTVPAQPAAAPEPDALLAELPRRLGGGNVVGKHWIIEKYDHEVQGGSVIKPLVGPGLGPSDAAVLRPRLDSQQGIALGCGMTPWLSDEDPYWMAAASIDEALRNVVAVGGDPARTAILDNFCWGSSQDPQQLGALVRACQACYDVSKTYQTPFVSGKDSLNNEFALEQRDVVPLLQVLREMMERPHAGHGLSASAWPEVAQQIRGSQRLRIVPTLLISALSLIDDVQTCCSSDLKTDAGVVALVGGLSPRGFDLATAAKIHAAIHAAIRDGRVRACHDVSDGGWLVALAEMAIGGHRGVELDQAAVAAHAPYTPLAAGYLIEVDDAKVLDALAGQGLAVQPLGRVDPAPELALVATSVPVTTLRRAWAGS